MFAAVESPGAAEAEAAVEAVVVGLVEVRAYNSAFPLSLPLSLRKSLALSSGDRRDAKFDGTRIWCKEC